MTKEECLERLSKACKELENIGEVVEFKRQKPDMLFGLILPIIQYYKYIQKNFKTEVYTTTEAMSYVLEMGENNPSLKGIVESILNSVSKIDQEKEFDKESFKNKITVTLEESKLETNLTESQLYDIQEDLEQLVIELESHCADFSQNEYDLLMELLSKKLKDVEQCYEVFNIVKHQIDS